MTDTNATIKATAQEFRNLIEKSALSEPGSDPPWIHSDLYLSITEESVEAIVSAGGGSVLTYCTFEESYFDSIEGEAEAVLAVEDTLERLDVASDGGLMEFEFAGPENSRLSETLRARGALEMAVSLPASEKILEKVPEELPERWEDGKFLSPSGNPHRTFVDTTVDQVAKVIEATELEGGEYFPIAVEEGDFVLNVGDQTEYLRGDLSASNVEGEDLENWYGPGFEAAFGATLSGDVQLQTTDGENGGHPMAVLQEDEDKAIRHVLVEVNPA